jgi:hypothetical protein
LLKLAEFSIIISLSQCGRKIHRKSKKLPSENSASLPEPRVKAPWPGFHKLFSYEESFFSETGKGNV